MLLHHVFKKPPPRRGRIYMRRWRVEIMDRGNLLYVAGKHDVGKTTFIEKLLAVLAKRGIITSVIKDIHVDGFCIDSEGKDTWRHWKAGASIVVARGLDETDILVKRQMALDEICPVVASADIVIAEGFKELHGRKVIVARAPTDYAEMKALVNVEDDVWGVAGPFVDGGLYSDAYAALSSPASLEALADRLEPHAKQARLHRNRLAMPMEAASCTLAIDGTAIEMKQYVAETLKNIIVGTIASLHWNTKVPVDRIDVAIGKDEGGAGWVAGVELNGNPISIKEFVQQAIAGAMLGYITTLKLPGDISVSRAAEILVKIE
jgi:molybdopterin-guanine dinucleotide biosynthesis protein MobB